MFSKKTIIIITIISVIISIISIIFSYFGLYRYLCLHWSSSESYINNYSNLEKASNDNRVVISLSTNCEKLEKIRPTLLSLLDQTVKVDSIQLNIPSGCKTEIPKDYKDMVTVTRNGKDYKNGNKYIPCLLREGECDTILIFLDDDYIYGKDFIETMVENANKFPTSTICIKENNNKYKAILVKSKYVNSNVNKTDNYSDNWLIKNIDCKIVNIKHVETMKKM